MILFKKPKSDHQWRENGILEDFVMFSFGLEFVGSSPFFFFGTILLERWNRVDILIVFIARNSKCLNQI